SLRYLSRGAVGSTLCPCPTLFRSQAQADQRPGHPPLPRMQVQQEQAGDAEHQAGDGEHVNEPAPGWPRVAALVQVVEEGHQAALDRKSTRLDSSHVKNSYAVLCLK